jgi:uncharacterized damage-inducible protein DinB
MQLHTACRQILDELTRVIDQIQESDFVRPAATLSNSTIGQHIRHTLEFFLCLREGFDKNLVNYDKRSHDKLIESDKYLALASISGIREFVDSHVTDKPLKLEVGYARTNEFETVDTNYFRELTYNIEHAVHHMALIKIGIRELAPYVTLPQGFGIAASTIRHQESIQASH